MRDRVRVLLESTGHSPVILGSALSTRSAGGCFVAKPPGSACLAISPSTTPTTSKPRSSCLWPRSASKIPTRRRARCSNASASPKITQLRRPKRSHKPSTSPAAAAARAYKAYEETLRKAGALDFDDLLLARRAKSCAASTMRAADWQQRFRFLHVDEYQDTNRVQYDLLRLLAGPQPNLCVVGDEDQSIYRWRGADIGNILRFTEDFPGARTLRIEQNYRSRQTNSGCRRRRRRPTTKNASANNSKPRAARVPTSSSIEARDAKAEADYVAAQVSGLQMTRIPARTWPCSTAPTRNRARLKNRFATAASATGSRRLQFLRARRGQGRPGLRAHGDFSRRRCGPAACPEHAAARHRQSHHRRPARRRSREQLLALGRAGAHSRSRQAAALSRRCAASANSSSSCGKSRSRSARWNFSKPCSRTPAISTCCANATPKRTSPASKICANSSMRWPKAPSAARRSTIFSIAPRWSATPTTSTIARRSRCLPAHRQGAGVRPRLPDRPRGRHLPAQPLAPRSRGDRRGAPLVLRRHDPRPRHAHAHARRLPPHLRQRAPASLDAVAIPARNSRANSWTRPKARSPKLAKPGATNPIPNTRTRRLSSRAARAIPPPARAERSATSAAALRSVLAARARPAAMPIHSSASASAIPPTGSARSSASTARTKSAS